MTEKMIAYCGIVCTECPGYVATQNNDYEALKQIAKQWTEEFGDPLTPEGCLCDGCMADGRKNDHCGECAVRACAIERGVVNCAHCDDYGCQTLTNFWKFVPETKATLEEIRKTLR